MELRKALGNFGEVFDFTGRRVPSNIILGILSQSVQGFRPARESCFAVEIVSDDCRVVVTDFLKKKDGVPDSFIEACTNASAIVHLYASKDEDDEWATPSCLMTLGALINNIILSAIDKGLAACFVPCTAGIGTVPASMENKVVIGSICIGVPKEEGASREYGISVLCKGAL